MMTQVTSQKIAEIANNIAIDEVDIDTENLYVYGKNLNQLISNLSFHGAIFHILVGRYPYPIEEKKINDMLIDSIRYFFDQKSMVMGLLSILKSYSFDIESGIITGLLYCEVVAKQGANTLMLSHSLDLPEAAEGLFLLGLIPVFIAYTVFFTKDPGQSTEIFIKYIRKKIEDKETDYVSFIFELLSNSKAPTNNQLKLFHSILVALHAGFGIITPTIILARFSASTMASTAKNYVAALTGSGPAHVGACNLAMALLKKSFWNNEEKPEVIFSEKKPFPGFGHPLLLKDPRNKKLLELFKQRVPDSLYISIYEKLVKSIKKNYGLNPNVDLITATLLLELGFPTNVGTPIFLFSRMASVLAHSIQKKQKPPFGLKSEDARKKIADLPKNWI